MCGLNEKEEIKKKKILLIMMDTNCLIQNYNGSRENKELWIVKVTT